MAQLNDCDAPGDLEHIDPNLSVSVTLNGGHIVKGDVKTPALKATWAPITSPWIVGIEFQYGPADLSAGIISKTALKGQQSWESTDGVVADQTYAVRYRAIGVGANLYGPWIGPSNQVAGAEWISTGFKDQGALAVLDMTDTADITPQAVTNFGWAEVSSVQTLTGTTPKTILTYTYTADGGGIVVEPNFWLSVWHPTAGGIDVRIQVMRNPGSIAIFDKTFGAVGGDFFQGWQSPRIPQTLAPGTYTFSIIITLSNNDAAEQEVEAAILTVRESKR